MDLHDFLSNRIDMNDIHAICFYTQGKENDARKEELYRVMMDDEGRAGGNAAWIFSHFALAENEWLYSKQQELMDAVMRTKSSTKRRLMMVLLERQPFTEKGFRADYLDFCLEHMAILEEPYGIRALCMKQAFVQCSLVPELLPELKASLELMDDNFLSSGLRTAKRNVLRKIKGIAKSYL
jgi:hypothetical protein